MRRLLAAAVWLLCATLSASSAPLDKDSKPLHALSRVDVAVDIYVGCVLATEQAQYDIEPTRVGINTYVSQVDENCLGWLVIWFKPLMGLQVTDLSDKELESFDSSRLGFLQLLTDRLRLEALIR